MLEIFQFDWNFTLQALVQILIAYVLALPIGLERETSERTAGLRTFPLVAVAACGYTIAGIHFLSTSDAEARVIQGLITGMGFIGGGAILKESGAVTGTATAAGLWAMGAMGMSVAMNYLEIAVLLSLTTFLTLKVFTRKKKTDAHSSQSNAAEPQKKE